MSRITVMLGAAHNSGDEFTVSSGINIRFMNTTAVDIELTTGTGFKKQVTVGIEAGAPNANRSKIFTIERGATELSYTWDDAPDLGGSSFATRRGTIRVT